MSYKSHADLGGQDGHGPVVPEAEGNPFHTSWEAKAFALTLAMGAAGQWNLDITRSARETLEDYADSSYYAIWVKALQELLLGRGLIHREEIAASRMMLPPLAVARVWRAADVAAALAKGSPTLRPANSTAKFSVGERVRTRAAEVARHTRLPGYARGKVGRIEHVHGVHVFADAHAQGLGEQPEWLYAVVFDARELWSDGALGASVSIDAWEPYLHRMA
jgi:nitrile hydratase beta subunit